MTMFIAYIMCQSIFVTMSSCLMSPGIYLEEAQATLGDFKP